MKIKKKGVINLERWNIHVGDCQLELKKIEPESVQTVVTSPPYWGLRDYQTASWDGGSDDCDHKSHKTVNSTYKTPDHHREEMAENLFPTQYKDTCLKCGAKRMDMQKGMENTPDEYVDGLVDVFREIRRVLKKDGTVWLNLGDSYGSGTTGRNDVERKYSGSIGKGLEFKKPTIKRHTENSPKNLVGIPWRVAFALQKDGWCLRSDIIWHKPNPMPESVQDRPTKSHEYIFLLSKSPHYYYDADAIREPHTWEESKPRASGMERNAQKYRDKVYGGNGSGFAGHSGTRKADGTSLNHPSGRNKRDVWTVNTKPFPEAHFATFPEKLIDTCIKAGSKENDIVLDPFSGAGTTGVVACKLNRIYIGIELNPEYAEMSKNRLAKTVGASVSQAKNIKSPGVQLNMI